MAGNRVKEVYHQILSGKLMADVIILDNVRELPIMNEEYMTNFLYIGLCKSGYTKGSYDYKEFVFKKGDICWLFPGHVMRHDEMSDDYEVMSIFASVSYVSKLDKLGLLPTYHLPFLVRCVSLTPMQFDFMLHSFSLSAKALELDSVKRHEILGKMCEMIALAGDDFIMQQCSYTKSLQTSHMQLFEKFINDVFMNHSENHEVIFYAGLQALSPKYFAMVIRNVSGKSANYWINRQILIHAKWMLRHEGNKTIQQIAYRLGFTEQSSFSRFFKDNTGMTPSEFRDMK